MTVADPLRSFIDAPKQTHVDEAARAALADVDPPAARQERVWEAEHPAGRWELGERTLVLWNFSVDSPDLKPEHLAGLSAFLGKFGWLLVRGTLHVEGRASASGAESRNSRLARARADAVAFRLSMRGVRMSALKVRAVGEVAASADSDPEALARDRSVVLSIEMPPPLPDNPFAPPVPIPAQQPGPDQSPEWWQYVPVPAVALKLPFGPFPLPVGIGLLQISGEVTLLKLGVASQKVSVNWEVDLREMTLKRPIEAWFSPNARVKFTPTLDPRKMKLAIGLRAHGVLWEAELEPDPRMPLAFAGTLPADFEDVILGVKVKVVEYKFRAKLIPDPRLVQRLASAGRSLIARIAPWAVANAAPIAGASLVAGSIAFVLYGAHKIDEAHELGREHAVLVQARRGYALRIACELTATSLSSREEDLVGNDAFSTDARKLGWEIAGSGWNDMEEGQRHVLFVALGARRGVPDVTARLIFELIGATAKDGTLPDPASLAEFARSRRLSRP